MEPAKSPASGPVAITGSSGLLGAALTARRGGAGQPGAGVRRLLRRREGLGPEDAFWDPAAGELEPAALAGASAVVHLAGESLVSGRWTDQRKRRLWSSRVDSTRLLAETLARMDAPPPVLVSASAVGIYGDRGDEALTEEAAAGAGFLAELCQAWEAATEPAVRAGIRVAHLRSGIVLSTEGGALPRLLTPFKLGLGGPLGNGRQYMSWIHIEDMVRVMERLLADDALRGPVHAVAPEPVTNAELAKTLGRVLRRPAVLPVPRFALKLGMGSELAEQALLAGQRVLPERLQAAGFEWRFPTLEGALKDLLT